MLKMESFLLCTVHIYYSTHEKTNRLCCNYVDKVDNYINLLCTSTYLKGRLNFENHYKDMHDSLII